MKRRRLWHIAVISIFAVLPLTTANPVGESFTYPLRWEHVNRTCRTRNCDNAVNFDQLRAIQSYMNPTADPCTSFHAYACGNWQREHPHSITMMKIANDRLTENYRTLFDDWLKTKKSLEALKGVQTLKARRACAAHNCLPERKTLAEIQEIPLEIIVPIAGCKENCGFEQIDAASANEVEPLRDPVIQKMIQYYEVCKESHKISLRSYFDLVKPRLNLQSNSFNWLDSSAELGRFGYSSHFLSMEVVQVNSSLHRLVIYPHDIEHHVELNEAMFEILSDFTQHNQSELQRRFNELEIDLLKSNCQYCLKTPVELSASEYHELDCDCFKNEAMTFASLSAQLPEVDWQRYLNPQLGRNVEANDILEVANLDLIKVQLCIIEQIDVEFQLLYTIASFLDYLLEQQENLQKHNSTELNCLHHMRKLFALPMTYVYEHAVYSSKRTQSEQVVEQIFGELKAQFALTIQRNKMQFSSAILPQLQSKLTNLRINVGNLPKNVSQNFYAKFILPYSFINDFHYNHLHALEVVFKQFNSLLDASAPELQNTWHSFNLHLPHFPDNLDATPYYYARSNLIVIPFSYLQTPFYDASFWPALLYGDLANTLGHEMMHAFDTEFLKYDENGNPSDQPFASMFLNPNFRRNLACLREGTVFVRERIADVSGARLALSAFLNLDPNALERNGQLYFLQFAQFFCGSADPLAFQLEDSTHDVDSLRLDYVLGVVPEFAEVFNCPIGSGMNPVAKCEMYR